VKAIESNQKSKNSGGISLRISWDLLAINEVESLAWRKAVLMSKLMISRSL